MHISYVREDQKESEHWEDQYMGVHMILRTEREWGCMEWIGLVRNRVQWRVLVNTVIQLRIL
jgi:hypothetical protein